MPSTTEQYYAAPANYVTTSDTTDPNQLLPQAIKTVPIILLINSGSASASEIVAGALQDYKRVNEGWQTLSQPLERACYLLSLQGIFVKNQIDTVLPKAWLEEQITWREAIDKARHHPLQLKILADELVAQIGAFCKALEALIEDNWQAATQIVQKWCFFAKLMQEVDDAIQSLACSSPHA